MSEVADWLDANGQFMAAAVGWVRLRLQSRVPPPAATLPLSGAPPAAEAARTFWRLRPRAPVPALPALAAPDPAAAETEARARMEAIAAEMATPPALHTLAARLDLRGFEQDTLLLCAAMELDTSIGPLCAHVQGDAALAFPTFALALNLFAEPSWDALSPERPLRHWRLLEITQPGATPLTVSALRADERIVNFLKGVTYLDDRLMPLLTALPEPGPDIPPSHHATAGQALHRLAAASAGVDLPPVQLLGNDPASKRVISALVCRQLGRHAYRLDGSLLPHAAADLETFARLWQRESMLLPIALYVDLDGADPAQTAAVERLAARVRGLVFTATRALSANADAPIAVEVAKPTEVEQRAAWAEALGERADDLPRALAAQFNLNTNVIREVVARETSDAETDQNTIAPRLWDACRALTRPRLDSLARRLEPRSGWDDIVLPAAELAMLHQIADQVGHRSQVYNDWGFAARMSRGLGISVLFAGTSGSGKTMAAEVLARHLRLDLFRIDLSAVVSKYIGETEVNLRRLFDAAEEGGAILLFDEADALFGKRTEVRDSHDRYANIEVNYLLQRMESYGGLAVLATNMKSALDPAFLRRIRFVVDFPFSGPAERKLIWQKAFPPQTPLEGLDWDRLARLNLVGGHIAVIALNAAFQAAQAGTPVTMPLVFGAARIEYRKLGRPVNEADFHWQAPARAGQAAA
jgi:hypothetical protein